MVKNSRTRFELFASAVLIIILIMVINLTADLTKKRLYIESFHDKTEVLYTMDIDINQLYDEHKIIKIVYKDYEVISCPDNYRIRHDFDYKLFKESGLNFLGSGRFAFRRYTEGELDTIFMYRVDLEDLYFHSSLPITVVCGIAFYIFLFFTLVRKDLIKDNIYNKVFYSLYQRHDPHDDVDCKLEDLYSDIVDYADFYILAKHFISVAEEGLIAINDKFQVVFYNNVISHLITQNSEGKDILINIPEFNEGFEEVQDKKIFTSNFAIQGQTYNFNMIKTYIEGKAFYVLNLVETTKQTQLETSQIEFYNQASHELRTPLTTIQGLVELLMICDLEGEDKKNTLELSFKECRRLDLLITSIIDLSKRFSYDELFTKVDMCEKIHDLYSRHYIQKVVNVKIETDNVVNLFANDRKLTVIINHLLGNALKLNYEGGFANIKLTNDGGCVSLVIENSVRDGQQIHCQRLFEAFSKEDYDNIRILDGYNIGLSIAESVCKSYGYSFRGKCEDNVCTISINFFDKKFEH